MQINPTAPFSMNFMAPPVAPTYDVEVFDMASAEDRKRYCDLMLKIAKLVQAQQAVIWRNDLQVLQKKDGNGWFRYLEWSQYALSKEAEQISKNEDKIRKESSEQFNNLRDRAKAGAEQALESIIAQALQHPAGVPVLHPEPPAAKPEASKKFVPPKPRKIVGKIHAVGSDDVSDADFFDEMTAWGDRYKELPKQFQPKNAMPGVRAVYA